MPPASVFVVVGNPRPGSRTASAAAEVGRRIARELDLDGDPEVIELAEHAPRLFDPEAAEVAALSASVANSRVCVFASPTYKATYTGMLKAFLDRYGDGGLAGVVAVPMMIGKAPHHGLAPEVHLRPLLVELGAIVPTRALYVVESQLPDLDAVVSRWLAGAAGALRRAAPP